LKDQRRQQHHHRRHVVRGAAYLLKFCGRRSSPLLAAAARPPPRLDAGDGSSRWRPPIAGDRAAAPGRLPGTDHVCALAIVFFSATQDIAIDAYRGRRVAAERARAGGRGRQSRYPFGSWIAVAVALVIADHFGWRLGS